MALTHFEVPNHLNAHQPIEFIGKNRDEVKLMILDRFTARTFHGEFQDLGEFLETGDVLVLNNSRTIPAVLKGKQGNRDIEIRLSRKVNELQWEALLTGGPYTGQNLLLPDNVKAKIIGNGSENPLVILQFSVSGQDFYNFLYEYGEPIRYEYIKQPWSLDSYQTVYSSVPGSVEMPSAGRAFSWRLLNELRNKGVELAFVQLHAGLSYYGHDQWPDPSKHPERFHIPTEAADKINRAKRNGKRVIAVGTTVVRTLETAGDDRGYVSEGSGVTHLYIHKETNIKVVDGLLTGLHEPEASHLDLLSAFVDREMLFKAYHHAIDRGYLWHEFGDMNLILSMRNQN
ncbi:S-adenosylmethionine:tRNA ribosyltransferase-isomerase [Bacillus mesophilus]|uniref:S-adenosylmethionine:tRNA ribosyltransferase-isomerase n=1 Tax=Bacillus mesophilus TaxID=1808955 RepID=A0A6M0QA81_9BACI|nr:S-adenosylmethionine:tRNA ribosyltransferase-isomerase [Bacillus mesophilus]MBM7662655.1 S-adenosylmethionine:tRNA ribosyltransferase-isomerase [Bacillus mesophilus]NEY73281.1 S-adenosylmethionine:tRNA ribosyltransferase-isomerase [Bacillus mesophilus]